MKPYMEVLRLLRVDIGVVVGSVRGYIEVIMYSISDQHEIKSETVCESTRPRPGHIHPKPTPKDESIQVN